MGDEPLQISRLDGFIAAFFYKSWCTTGPPVLEMEKRILDGGELSEGLAEALLVLIPLQKGWNNFSPSVFVTFIIKSS